MSQQEKPEKISGFLSDGSEYRCTSGNGRTWSYIEKCLTIDGFSFCITKYPEGQGEEMGLGRCVYNIRLSGELSDGRSISGTAHLNNHTEVIKRAIGCYTGGAQVEIELLSSQIFVNAVTEANMFDFDHPEIMKIIGEG